MGRFDYLKNQDEELYKLCHTAEKRLGQDENRTTLLHIRLSIEYIMKRLGYTDGTLDDNIKAFVQDNNVDKRIVNMLKDLRINANKNGNHYNENTCDNNKAKELLNKLKTVCNYFYPIEQQDYSAETAQEYNRTNRQNNSWNNSNSNTRYEYTTYQNDHDNRRTANDDSSGGNYSTYDNYNDFSMDEIYGQGMCLYNAGEYDSAFNAFVYAGKNYHAESCFMVGFMQEHIYSDIDNALEWYDAANRFGDPRGQEAIDRINGNPTCDYETNEQSNEQYTEQYNDSSNRSSGNAASKDDDSSAFVVILSIVAVIGIGYFLLSSLLSFMLDHWIISLLLLIGFGISGIIDSIINILK